jgi:hypothetical protein
MTTQPLYKTVAFVVLLAGLASGCAKEKSGGTVAQVPSPMTTLGGGGFSPEAPRDTDLARGTEWQSGAITNLNIDSVQALDYYAVTHVVNNPTDVKISVKLYDVGGNQYAGHVMVSYIDNNQFRTAKFITGNQTVARGTSHGHDGKNHAVYNKWFTWGGQNVFHGFYEDQYGALMIIVDRTIDQGDGGGANEVGGSIWFKNHNISPAPRGQIPCWFIELGPYDCRTFLINREDLVTTSALYPSQSLYFTPRSINPFVLEEPARGWRRLGTFNGLNRSRAFGN